MVAYLWILTSQVILLTWLVDHLINPNNLHVSRKLIILIVVLVEMEQKAKLTRYWPVYGQPPNHPPPPPRLRDLQKAQAR